MLIFRREVAADRCGDLRVFQRRDQTFAEALTGDADLAVVGNPDEMRDQSAVREALAVAAEVGHGRERKRDFFRDQDGLIDRYRIRGDAGASARPVDDVSQRATAAVLMRHVRNAVEDVDDLLFDERIFRQHRRDGVRFVCALRECLPIAAGQLAQRHHRAQVTIVDPAGTPELTKRVALEFLEQDVRAELLIRSRFRRHNSPELRLCGCRIPPPGCTYFGAVEFVAVAAL